jgi:SAM-dependent methyltransferase
VNDFERRLSQGVALHQQRRDGEALEIARQLLAYRCDEPRALELLGVACVGTNRADLALQAVVRALATNPALAEPAGCLGPALRSLASAAFVLDRPSQEKHLWQWFESLREDYLLTRPSPWFAFDAIDLLRRRLRPGLRIFEYGCGGSTLFWLESRPSSLVSIEHDEGWFREMNTALGDSAVVDLRLVPPEPEPEATNADPASPDAYRSSSPDFPAVSFRRYASQIDAFPDGHFDIVAIDGRARPSCIKHAHAKVRPGGLLVIDDADRGHYFARTRPFLEGYAMTRFDGVFPHLTFRCATAVGVRLG